MDPIVTLTAVASVLKIVDSLTGQWDRFRSQRTDDQPDPAYRVTTEQVQRDAMVVKEHGKVVRTITASDIAKLDRNTRQLICALESSMQRQFNLWSKVYPMRLQSADPFANAQVEQRLENILGEMCKDLGKIFSYLDSIGAHLNDHYHYARYLCVGVEQKLVPASATGDQYASTR